MVVLKFLEFLHSGKAGEGVEEARFDGAEGAMGDGGDAFEGFARVKTEVHDGALPGWELIEAMADEGGAVECVGGVAGAGRFARVVGRGGGVELDGEANAEAAEPIVVAMKHDAAKPGEEAGAAIVAGEMFPGFEEGVLEEVEGLV